jgi:RraA family protein
MHPRIRAMWKRACFVGSAFTVRTEPGEFAAVEAALAQARPGDVLVIDGGAAVECALWGERMSRLALERGIVGVVIDGAVRDLAEIEELAFPVFAITTSPSPPARDLPGELGLPIKCGDRLVQPGDIIYGDRDGLVVVPSGLHADVIARARIIESSESGS